MQLNVQQNEDEEFDVTVELTSYAEKFSDEINGAFFGQNAILLGEHAVLRVGDLLEIA